MAKFNDPFELLKEIEAWLSFNQEPNRVELANMKLDIKQFMAEYYQYGQPKQVKEYEDKCEALFVKDQRQALIDFYYWKECTTSPPDVRRTKKECAEDVDYYYNQMPTFTNP